MGENEARGTRTKVVCVLVESEDFKRPYEVAFVPSTTPDIELITSSLKKKSKILASKFEEDSIITTFEKQSEFFEGSWTVVGDNSPVKDRSKLKLTFSRNSNAVKPLALAEDEAQHSSEEVLSLESAIPETVPVVVAEQPTGFGQSVSESDRSSSGSDTTEVESSTTNNNLAKSQGSSQQMLKDKADSASRKSNASMKKGGSGSKPVPEFNLKKFKLPSCFGLHIHKKIENGQTLDHGDFDEIAQQLCLQIMAQTHGPEPDDLKAVEKMFFAKYPTAIFKNAKGAYDEKASIDYLHPKMQRRMGKLRNKAGLQLSSGGGRPPKQAIVRRPCALPAGDAPDMVSYLANVDMMMDLYKASGDQASIKSLFRLTFPGRHYEVLKGLFDGTDNVIQKRCPLLRQPFYLYEEMNMIAGKDICVEMRQKWLDAVPILLRMAKDCTATAIRSTLRSYDRNELLTEFDIQSSAAIECLPLLIPNKKKENIRLYLLDHREDSANITEVVNEKFGPIKNSKIRTAPYIIKSGLSYTIVADGKVFVDSVPSSMEALVLIMAVYYSFNIQWCEQIISTLKFLDWLLLDVPVPERKDTLELRLFVSKYRNLKDQSEQND